MTYSEVPCERHREVGSCYGADIDLLAIRRAQHDVASERRAVDFTFVTDTEAKARAIAGFLMDFGYAATRIHPEEASYRILASIEMPLDQQLLLSVSGFMFCIGELFSGHYDGWGAVVVPSA
jgi:hypothetical protein